MNHLAFHRKAAEIHRVAYESTGDEFHRSMSDLHEECCPGGIFGQPAGTVPSQHSGPKAAIPDDLAKLLEDSLRP